MVKFTSQEVSALQGGRNASAKEIYLKEWDPERNYLPDSSRVDFKIGLKLITVDQSFAEKHYADLSAKSLFRGMVDYIISGPMCAMFEEYSFNNYNSVFLYRKCPGTYLLPYNSVIYFPHVVKVAYVVSILRSNSHNGYPAQKGKSKETEQQVDIGMERLLKAAEGHSLSREFELLKALRASLNNFFTYKKTLNKTINFIRVILVTRNNFKEKRIVININYFGVDRCIQVSLNYLITRRASELDILINKVNKVIYEDTLLLNELKKAQVAIFPEAYLQPSKGVKTVEDEDMIKLLGRYLKNAETNFPKTQINTNGDLDDDEQKKDDQKVFGSNPSQPSKATDSKT
ncbi:hypothetical protein AgCh_028126 [Apium graveolens]